MANKKRRLMNDRRTNDDNKQRRLMNDRRTNNDNKKNKRSIFNIIMLVITIYILYTHYNIYNVYGFAIIGTIMLIGIILPLIIITIYLINDFIKRKRKKYIGTIILLIIYFVMTIPFNYISSKMVSSSDVVGYKVVTSIDNQEVDSIEDIPSGESIGVLNEGNTYGYDSPVEDLSSYGFEFTSYGSYLDSVKALYDGAEEYIVIDDVYNPIVNDKYPTFSDDVKIIYEKTISQNVKTNIGKTTNLSVAVCGTDTRTNTINSNSRCDSVSVASVDFNEKSINLVSIPRDAYIQNSCLGIYDKVTHAGLEGMDCYMQTLSNFLDIQIDAYVKVNFTTVIDIINAVGGIDVEVDQAFYGQDENDNDNAYYFTPGMMHMDGEMALSYARERKSFVDGDYTRAYHQQQVMVATGESIKNMGLIEAIDLIDVISNSFRTNLSVKSMTTLITQAFNVGDFTINSYVVEGYGEYVDIPQRGLYGTSVQIIYEDSLNEAKELLN